MGAITAGLQRIIERQKRKMELQEKRLEERHKKMAASMAMSEEALKSSKEEEETKKVRRRGTSDRPFRGCTEEEAVADLVEIFSGVKSDKYMHILPDGRTMVVIKKQVVREGDIIKIEKGELFEIGVVKHLHKGALVLESKEREKKYPLSKLLSSRYVVSVQIDI